MLKITTAAINKIKKENQPNSYFRVGFEAGGCKGVSSQFVFCPEPSSSDIKWEESGLKFCSDAKSLKMLDAMTLNYESSLMKKGFVLLSENLNSCSCGKSFAAGSQLQVL